MVRPSLATTWVITGGPGLRAGAHLDRCSGLCRRAGLRPAGGGADEGRERIPPHHHASCWGCGDNPDGIHLPLPAEEGIERYEATFSFAERHQAAPGIVHGGLVGAALARACGDDLAVSEDHDATGERLRGEEDHEPEVAARSFPSTAQVE